MIHVCVRGHLIDIVSSFYIQFVSFCTSYKQSIILQLSLLLHRAVCTFTEYYTPTNALILY